MGEPTLKLPPEDRPDIRPNLRVLEGGGETTDRKSGHLKTAGGDEGSLYKTEGDENSAENQEAEALGRDASETAEETGFRARAQKAKKVFWGSKRRKAATIGLGGITGIAGGGIITFFIMLAPLKIMSMTQNLQDHFFASGHQAASDMSDKLLYHYLVKKVMPGMIDGKCNSTRITKNCAVPSDNSTVVGQLFNAWRDGRLENKLATKYGFEIIKDGNNNFYIKTEGMADRIELGKLDPNNSVEFENKAFQRLNRNDLRREARSAFDKETLWKRVMHKYMVGGLLERKYGVKRCIIACKPRDALNDKIDSKKAAFQSVFIERVVGPRSEMYSLALSCAMSSFDCTGDDEIDEDGNHSNKFDRDVQAKLQTFRATYGQQDLDELYDRAKDIREKGIVGHFITRLVGEATAKLLNKAIPIVGWIDLGARLVKGVQEAGPAITKMNYAMYAATAVSTYTLYRTSADEIKTGKVDPEAVGSVAASLSASKDADNGGLSAEQTALYKHLNGTTASSSVASLFTPSAFAAEQVTSAKTCNDKKSPAAKQVVCPELIVGHSGVLGGIGNQARFLSESPMISSLGIAADVWLSTLGQIIKYLEGVAGEIIELLIELLKKTPFGPWIDKASEVLEKIMESVVNYLFPSPFSDKPSGGRYYEVAAAGADFAGNDFTHSNLGGRVLKPEEVAAVQQRKVEEAEAEQQQQSLYARVFDTKSSSSLVSRVALATPSGYGSNLSSSLNSLFQNPLHGFLNGFGAIFQTKQSDAAAPLNIFGITQYGIPRSEIQSIGDPELYWERNCTDMTAVNKAWGEAAKENPETGQFENDSANLCKLIDSASRSGGGRYDASLLGLENATATGGGSKLRIATYNIRGAHHTGGVFEERLTKAINVIRGSSTDGVAIDVVGLQEFEAPQRESLLAQIGNIYDIYPETAQYSSDVDDGPPSINSIIWNKEKFSKVDGGIMPGLKYFNGRQLNAPWVILEDTATGQQFYILNTHDPAKPENAELRFQNANQHVKFIKSIKSSKLPIYFTGDFNSGFSRRSDHNITYQDEDKNLTYCILTKDGLMKNVYDEAENRSVNCPNPGNENSVDHVYVSSEIEVNKYFRAKDSGSDHDAHIADTTIPGATSAGIGELRIATYNVLASWNSGTTAFDPEDAQRYRQIASLIKSENIHIVATQETRREERKVILDALDGYGATAPQPGVSDTIYYQKSLFSEEKYGVFNVPKSTGSKTAVWAKLKSKSTGGVLYVINLHAMVGTEPRDGAERAADARITLDKMNELVGSSGDPVVILGDMNSNYYQPGRNQIFEIFKNSGKLKLTYSETNNRKGANCDTHQDMDGRQDCRPSGVGSHIDQIWVSNASNIRVNRWENVANSTTVRLSDHNPVIADLTIKGITGDNSSSGWQWPATKIHAGPCWNAYVAKHGYHAGMDMNTDVRNVPALAAHSGTVWKVGRDDAAGLYVTVKVSDNLYYSYEHLSSNNVHAQDEIDAGDKIGIIGTSGDAPNNEGHLHMVVSVNGSLGSYSSSSQKGGDTRDPLNYLPKNAPNNYSCTP